jgi:spore coat protein H
VNKEGPATFSGVVKKMHYGNHRVLSVLPFGLTFLVLSLAVIVDVGRGAAPATRPVATTRPAAKNPKLDAADAYFTNGIFPTLRIEIVPAQLKHLNDNPRTPVHAIVHEKMPGQPEVIYKDVAVHLKGGPGSFRKVEDKPALTLNFDKFVDGQTFHGLDKVHLNNSVQDSGYVCEYLGSYVFRAAGCPAPRVSAGRVWLNGRDLGAFVIKEGFDNVFFKKFFHDRSGNLYEGNFADVDSDLPVHAYERYAREMGPFTKEVTRRRELEAAADKKKASAKLKELADAAREVDAVTRRQSLDKVLDVDRFLTFLACESLVNHWDGYCSNRNNYRIYDDPRSDKLVFLPQGMDQLFQNPGFPLFTSGGMVARAVTLSVDDRQHYMERVAKIRQTVFTPEGLLAQLDLRAAQLLPLMQEIGPDAVRQHKEQMAAMRQRIVERISNIDGQLAHPPRPIDFDSSGIAKLTGWEPKQLEGEGTTDQIDETGKPRLRLSCKSPAVISWRTPALLSQGHYVFEGRMKTTAVSASAGPNAGVGLRISGEKDRPVHLTGNNDWKTVQYDFEVTESLAEIVLVCELHANSGTVLIDPASLVLRKKK